MRSLVSAGARVSLLLCVVLSWQTQIIAQADPTDALRVEVGLGGIWKLGHVTPVSVSLGAELQEKATEVSVTTVDGDGVEVNYRRPLDRSQNQRQLHIPIRVGRASAPLIVRVIAGDEVVAEQSVQTSPATSALPSDQPLIVAIGSTMGVEQLSRASVDGSSETFSTALLDTAGSLPNDWRHYSMCDLIVISTTDRALINQISAEQWAALDSWVRRGGGCVIALGGVDNSQADGSVGLPQPLLDLLPGRVLGVGRILNPGTVESLVSTDEPLQPFDVSLLEPGRGQVEVSLTDTVGRTVPWWISYAHGHGFVQLLASSLDGPAFADWKDRKLLWERLVDPYVDREVLEGKNENASRDSSYLGYSDLVGQLRASLDVFSGVTVISFGQLAATLIGILLVVGPIDYLVSVRWLRRPQVSWYFAGFSLLLACAGLAWYYHSIRPDQLIINTAQIIDIDVPSQRVNGRLWSHVYSGKARRATLSATATNSDAPICLDWQGLPGRGLGGLLSQLNTDRGMPAYSISISDQNTSTLENVGIPAAGTKCIVGTWTDSLDLNPQSRLVEIPGVNQLAGELVNPLDVDLLEPTLFYHGWFYSLNSRIQPGELVTIAYDTIPRDMSRRLNRRRTLEGSDTVTPWDPSDRLSIDRLLELMMFHRAASGRAYTSLFHRYQPILDQSNMMRTDRAILVGRLEKPWAAVEISLNEAEAAKGLALSQDKDRVWCRIAIPVAKEE
ncbi:MAG: hypothetical protein KDB22_14930 [Planctomycetales bacterium]|nr:hypothetical protein [Planctomycetales bacterium]